jgi:hypothetical protein
LSSLGVGHPQKHPHLIRTPFIYSNSDNSPTSFQSFHFP